MLERAGKSQFVGRERELALLEAGFREACAGRGCALSIIGDPGIGKTRLVEEFTRRLDESAEPVPLTLWGRCPESGGVPAYWPWRQALARLLELHHAEAPERRTGAEAEPWRVLAALRGERMRGEKLDAEQAPFALLEAVVHLLRVSGDRQPLVLVLDDVHWADEASLKLLGHVVRELRGCRVLLLLTYREVEIRRQGRPLGEVLRFSRRVGLGGLAEEEIERFVAFHGERHPSQALLARLGTTTEGNPFFLEELVALLRESGELESGGDAVARIALPESVRQAIRCRIEPLPREEQELLELAAVIGREFSVVVLAAATGIPTETLLGQLTGALAAGLVESLDELGGFRFAHALIRETLYSGVLPASRLAAHRRIALALEQRLEQGADVPLAALAHHFFLAVPVGEAAKAATYAENAGVAALRQFAWDEATLQFDRAIAALGFAGDDPERRIRLLLSYGNAAQRAGDTARAAEAFARSARLARDHGDTLSLAIAAIRHAFARGAFLAAEPAVVRLLETALAEIGTADHPARVGLLTSLSAQLLYSREREKCSAICSEALGMARRLGEPTALATALMAQHFVLLGSPDIAERLALADEALLLARQSGRIETEWSAWALRVNDLLEAGDVASAESETERLVQLGDASRRPLLQWCGFVARSCLALLGGRFADAERFSAEALAARRRGQDAAVAQIFVTQGFFRCLETGGLPIFEESVSRFTREFPDQQGWRPALGLILAHGGREAEARTLFAEISAQDFVEIPDGPNTLGDLALLALLAHRLEETSAARSLYPRLAPFESHTVITFIQPVICLGSVSRYLGLLAATMGDIQSAARHFEDAIAMNTRIGARPYLARSQVEYAQLLLARDGPGDRERASALSTAARAIAEPIGQQQLRDELDTLDARLRPTKEKEKQRAKEAVPVPDRPPEAGVAAFTKEAGLWRISYLGESFHLKDSRGLEILSTLLRHPGRELHVLDLVGGHRGEGTAASAGAAAELSLTDLGDAGEMLDSTARAAYGRRIEDLRDELEEAERFNDVGRAERARHEIEFLSSEIARGVGLGGRSRRAGSAAERARQNVSRTVAAALKKIAEGSPALGQHLTATVHTGLFCSYDPRLVPSIAWSL